MAHDIPRPRMLRGDEAELFRLHADPLRRAIGAAVSAPDACIEDACSFAWLQLLRCQPHRSDTLFSWLYTVGVRQAWHLARRERRDDRLEDVGPAAEPSVHQVELVAEAHEALATLAALPDRQRRYLTLLVAGHSYDEVAARCDATHTNVNKHLVRARRTIRHLRAID